MRQKHFLECPNSSRLAKMRDSHQISNQNEYLAVRGAYSSFFSFFSSVFSVFYITQNSHVASMNGIGNAWKRIHGQREEPEPKQLPQAEDLSDERLCLRCQGILINTPLKSHGYFEFPNLHHPNWEHFLAAVDIGCRLCNQLLYHIRMQISEEHYQKVESRFGQLTYGIGDDEEEPLLKFWLHEVPKTKMFYITVRFDIIASPGKQYPAFILHHFDANPQILETVPQSLSWKRPVGRSALWKYAEIGLTHAKKIIHHVKLLFQTISCRLDCWISVMKMMVTPMFQLHPKYAYDCRLTSLKMLHMPH